MLPKKNRELLELSGKRKKPEKSLEIDNSRNKVQELYK
jgi:hypothetical protein